MKVKLNRLKDKGKLTEEPQSLIILEMREILTNSYAFSPYFNEYYVLDWAYFNSFLFLICLSDDSMKSFFYVATSPLDLIFMFFHISFYFMLYSMYYGWFFCNNMLIYVLYWREKIAERKREREGLTLEAVRRLIDE